MRPDRAEKQSKKLNHSNSMSDNPDSQTIRRTVRKSVGQPERQTDRQTRTEGAIVGQFESQSTVTIPDC